MDISPLLILPGIGLAIFAGLLKYGGLGLGGRIRIVVAALAAIDFAAMIGLGWFAAGMWTTDGPMIVELSICAALIAVLALCTGGAFALQRRGRAGIACALLAVVAVPSVTLYGFLLYLDSHPIDMR